MSATLTQRKETKNLLCVLTRDELLERGDSLARASEDISNEEDAQADQKAAMKARLLGLEAERSRLASIVRRKAEFRDVGVTVNIDLERSEYYVVRDDTGEEIFCRPITENERQGELFPPAA